VNEALEDEHGFTALHMAVGLESLELTDLVLSLGAISTTPDHYGITPLHIAAELASLSLLKMMVERGSVAHCNVLDARGNPPLFYAINAGRLQNVKFLQRFSLLLACSLFPYPLTTRNSVHAELALVNTAGFTAAHLAVCSFSPQILQCLLDAGAPMDLPASEVSNVALGDVLMLTENA
jgi:ankyrin repeat protein